MVGIAVGKNKPAKVASKSSVRRLLEQPTRNGARAGSAAIALILFGTTGALAQNCSDLATPIGNAGVIANVPAGAASAIAGSLGNISTTFQTQQTSAFVAGSTATQPDQASGGVWARAVGGRVDVKSDTTANVTVTAAGAVAAQGTVRCDSKVRQTFAGFQVGRDIARLNWYDWNVHLGATAGYLEAQGEDIAPGSIKTEFKVPFIGTYAVATRGSFFSDLMIRRDFYNVSMNQPAFNLHNQQFGARAWSVSVGAGYNFALQDGWFVEPSAGFIWSRTAVDQIGLAGPPSIPIGGTLVINDIDSKIGRATLRAGRNFTSDGMAWQPFASASIFREFAGNVTSNFVTCANCAFIPPDPATLAVQNETSRVGTYGQFSAGVAGQVIGTGWVGFVRGDYRKGDDIEGWAANGGLRYNFVPDAPAPRGKMVVKAKALVAAPYNWSGFYVGGHFGAAQGKGHVGFVGTGVEVDPYIGGYLLGGQAGYNFQNGSFVAGVEVDVSKTNINGTRTCGTSPGVDGAGVTVAFSPLLLTCRSDFDWLATAAVRLGVTAWWSDRTLFYVKGGGAWAREEVTVGCILGPNNSAAGCRNAANVFTNGFSATHDKVGGMIGVGSEFGLTRDWSAKAEFTYIRFRDHDVTATDGTVLNIGASVAEAKIGVNYRFGSGPIIARY
jgi:opacity protein-like surface antigen